MIWRRAGRYLSNFSRPKESVRAENTDPESIHRPGNGHSSASCSRQCCQPEHRHAYPWQRGRRRPPPPPRARGGPHVGVAPEHAAVRCQSRQQVCPPGQCRRSWDCTPGPISRNNMDADITAAVLPTVRGLALPLPAACLAATGRQEEAGQGDAPHPGCSACLLSHRVVCRCLPSSGAAAAAAREAAAKPRTGSPWSPHPARGCGCTQVRSASFATSAAADRERVRTQM